MVKVSGTVIINTEMCKGCELCIPICPQDSLALSTGLNKHGYHFTELVNNLCTGCTNCALVCPEAVITVYRMPKIKAVDSARTMGVPA